MECSRSSSLTYSSPNQPMQRNWASCSLVGAFKRWLGVLLCCPRLWAFALCSSSGFQTLLWLRLLHECQSYQGTSCHLVPKYIISKDNRHNWGVELDCNSDLQKALMQVTAVKVAHVHKCMCVSVHTCMHAHMRTHMCTCMRV